MKKGMSKIVSSMLLAAMMTMQLGTGVFAESGAEFGFSADQGQVFEFDLGGDASEDQTPPEAVVFEMTDGTADLEEAFDIVNATKNRLPKQTHVGVTGVELTDKEMDAVILLNNADKNSSDVVEPFYKGSSYNHTSSYYYSQMTSGEKKLYKDLSTICSAFLSSTKNVSSEYLTPVSLSDYGVSFNKAVQVYFALYYSNPQYYFLYGSYAYNTAKTMIAPVTHEDFLSASARKSMSAKIDTITASWMNTFNTLNSDLKKEKCVAEAICKKVTYSYYRNGLDQSMAAALGYGKCVCNGYSMTAAYFLNALGIDCITVVSETHAWNRVKLGGVWYQLDTTWMDDDYTNKVDYTWFNKSEKTFLKNDPDGDHVVDMSYYTGWTLPSCTKDDAEDAAAKPAITAIKAADGRVAIVWSAVPGATQYRIYTYRGSYTPVATVPSTTRSYTVTGLTNGVKMGFLVRANVNGKWTAYKASDVKFETPTGPVKPVIEKLKTANGRIAVKWYSVAGATQYKVYTYINGKYALATTVSGSENVCNVTGLKNGVKTGILVRACVNGKWTAYTTADIKYATPNP